MKRFTIGSLAVIFVLSCLSTAVHADAGFAGAGTVRNPPFFSAFGSFTGPIAGDLQGEPIAGVLVCNFVIHSGNVPSPQQPRTSFEGSAECERGAGPALGAPGPWEVEFEGTFTATLIRITGTFGEPESPVDPVECAGHVTPSSPDLSRGELQIACLAGSAAAVPAGN